MKDLKLSKLKKICDKRANCFGCTAEDFCSEFLADDRTPSEFVLSRSKTQENHIRKCKKWERKLQKPM